MGKERKVLTLEEQQRIYTSWHEPPESLTMSAEDEAYMERLRELARKSKQDTTEQKAQVQPTDQPSE